MEAVLTPKTSCILNTLQTIGNVHSNTGQIIMYLILNNFNHNVVPHVTNVIKYSASDILTYNSTKYVITCAMHPSLNEVVC